MAEDFVGDLQKFDSYVPNCVTDLKPIVGKIFSSVDDGVEFYKSYARHCGFDIRLSTVNKSCDSTVLWRYVVCNREGSKNVRPDNASKIVRRRLSTRCGCMARVVLKYSPGLGYVVENFIESHNHALLQDNMKHFLKLNRSINFVHRKFILDCARANIGPMQSFKMLNEFLGGFSHVGCTSVDVKNFSRDMKAFVNGADAQMLLNQLANKKEMCSAFTFDYEVDAEDKLSRLFWCDPLSKRNYHLYGEVVSFDATYSTNRYCMIFAPFTGKDNHGKCVTFGAGLLSGEDADSYSWLLSKFKDAMGVCPKIIITDQDLGLKVAVERVLVGTRHRFCMWHIMLKVADKVSPELRKDEDLKKKLNNVVWSEIIDPEQFEVGWEKIMEEYGLADDGWFVSMYEVRQFWIPAYFRDIPMGGLMKTTSMSESENSFFGKYTRARSNLLEFLIQFDNALEAQRHASGQCNYVDETAVLNLSTSLSIEKSASEFYTSSIFSAVQKEIFSACFECSVVNISIVSEVQLFKIRDRYNCVFSVKYVAKDCTVSCSCKMFLRIGLLCRHIFFVLKNQEVSFIPEQYLVGRWKKKSLLICQGDSDALKGDSSGVFTDEKKVIMSKIMAEFYSCVGMVDGNYDRMTILLSGISDLKCRFIPVQPASSAVSDKSSMLESFYGSSVPSDIAVLPPNVVKTKGSGSRLKSRKEKLVKQAKKALRKCRNCKQMGHHDSRNCPND